MVDLQQAISQVQKELGSAIKTHKADEAAIATLTRQKEDIEEELDAMTQAAMHLEHDVQVAQVTNYLPRLLPSPSLAHAAQRWRQCHEEACFMCLFHLLHMRHLAHT